jgi:hypothetical protein
MERAELYLLVILIVVIVLIGVAAYYALNSPLPQNSPTGYPIKATVGGGI